MTISPMIVAIRVFIAGARLPQSRDEPARHLRRVRHPSGIVGQWPLLGLDTVQERQPSRQHQQKRADIPFLKVVPNIAEHVGEVYRMTHDSIRAPGLEAPQRRANPESTA